MYHGMVVGSTETLTIAQNSTKFTSVLPFDKCNGFAGAIISVSAGTVTLSQQCGTTIEGTFYDPVDESNIALGVVATTMSAGTRYVQYDPVICKFMRFKAVETNVASTTVTITPFSTEDR